jgi:DNA-binding MurR/RpiR family transcriptional regulator
MTPRESKLPLLQELSRVYQRLTVPQRRVADFILTQPEKAREASVLTICEATRTSEPVVFAVCRAAGRRGYREMKLDLAGELAVLRERRRASGSEVAEGGPDVELDGSETPEVIFGRIGAAYSEAMGAAVQSTDRRAFARAVELVSRAGRVAIIGMGISGHIAQLGQYALVRAGVAATCSTDSYVQLAQVAALGKGDVAVALSYMGEQPEIGEALGLARRRGASTVAVTCQREAPLAREADVILELPPRRPLGSYVSVGARIAAAELLVVDALAAAVALTRRKEFDERAAAVREVVEERKGGWPGGRRAKKGEG